MSMFNGRRSRAAAAILIFGLSTGPMPLWGQARTQGTYSATVKVSGTETRGDTRRVTYQAEIKMKIPVPGGNRSSAVIDISDVSAPSATVTVTQYNLEERNATPDSDGKITSWKCELAGPSTVPMMASGMLNLNYSKQNYSMYVSLVAIEETKLKCVNSRTGPYTRNETMGFFFGTTEPDSIPHDELPYKDAAQIAAKFRLVPKGAMKEKYLPQDQEWELTLVK